MQEKEKLPGGWPKKTELTCIRCPIGCMLTVTENQDGTIGVTGNTCSRGEEYGKKETKDPTRTVTSTMKVKNGIRPVVPVKTKGDIPKGKIADCMEALKRAEAEAPVRIGDILLKNVAAFCHHSKYMPEAKLKSFGTMALAEEISRQPNIDCIS